MANKAKKLKESEDNPIAWMFEEDGQDHPYVDEMARWYLHARCPHQEQNLDAGILHHSRDCAQCLHDQTLRYMVVIKDLLRPVALHCHPQS